MRWYVQITLFFCWGLRKPDTLQEFIIPSRKLEMEGEVKERQKGQPISAAKPRYYFLFNGTISSFSAANFNRYLIYRFAVVHKAKGTTFIGSIRVAILICIQGDRFNLQWHILLADLKVISLHCFILIPYLQ